MKSFTEIGRYSEILFCRNVNVCFFFRDNNKPINILTGIDYWLDNLMCNVPELVMCFHVNGIVQVNYSSLVCLFVFATSDGRSDVNFEIMQSKSPPPHPLGQFKEVLNMFPSPAEIRDDKNGGHPSPGKLHVLHQGGERHRPEHPLLPQVQLHQRGSHLLAFQRCEISENTPFVDKSASRLS